MVSATVPTRPRGRAGAAGAGFRPAAASATNARLGFFAIEQLRLFRRFGKDQAAAARPRHGPWADARPLSAQGDGIAPGGAMPGRVRAHPHAEALQSPRA